MVFHTLICNFATVNNQNRREMDTSVLPLTTDFLRDLGIIAQDKNRMQRAIRYIKRLAAEKTEDPTLMTKEEYFARIENASKGPSMRFDSVEELDQYIRSL